METTPLTRNNFAQLINNMILHKLRLIETFVTPMGKIDVLRFTGALAGERKTRKFH